jgi:ubiquinol-cytochrome c reductase iron-sulfur subunit
MNHDDVDVGRRRFLTTATTVIGGVGAAYVALPFLSSWQPSEKAVAAGAPQDADISKLEPGAQMRIEWQGKPVFVLRRTKEMLAELPKLNDLLRDPESKVASQQPLYATNIARSIKPEYLVVVGICTHLGCVPLFKPEVGAVGPEWQGGFFCPCHGSKYDLAGRVYKGVPAPMNLEVPPYQYLSETVVRVGSHDSKGA